MAMKSIGEALSEMLDAFTPVGDTRLPLLRARGLVTCDNVLAQHDLPGFDNSAMDGYAVRFDDLREAKNDEAKNDEANARTAWPVIGESRAGGPLPEALAVRSVMRIFTGAPMPPGADTVIIQENAERSIDTVVFNALPDKRGANVRRRGSDVVAGELCMSAGSILEAGEIGVLAAQGIAEVQVHRPPRVAIVCTGDELRDVGEPLTPGALYNSNRYALAAAVESVGAEAWMLPIARDTIDDIATTLRHAFEADVVLCSGGVSVGDYDLVGVALQQLKVEARFHKVAMKPGKPLMLGVRDGKPFVGLPGNPVSAWVAFEVFVRPALRKMLGHVHVHPRVVQVSLPMDHVRSTGRMELARARLEHRGTSIVAHLAAQQGSGSTPSLRGIDGLVIFPADRARIIAGEPLRALVLHEARGHADSAFT